MINFLNIKLMDEEVLKKLREYSSTPVVYRINEIGTERGIISEVPVISIPDYIILNLGIFIR